MKRKILVFESRALCYHSANCFLTVLCKEFARMGIETEYCRIDSIQADEKKLLSYIGKTYFAVLDINSDLVLAFLEQRKDYYFNLINAPFYHIILDHPMHLHEKLSVPLIDYHVICLDKYHAGYIKDNYPGVKDVFVLHYGGVYQNEKIPEQKEQYIDNFSKRPWDVFFPATYVPEYYFLDEIKRQGESWGQAAFEVKEMVMSHESGSTEEACQCIIKPESFQDDREKNYLYCLIDRFLRSSLRNEAVSQLLKSGREVHVMGANWNLYQKTGRRNLVLHQSVSYQEVFSYLKNSKIMFNTQPLFRDGPHDRVMNGLANGMAVLTDSCEFLAEHFIHKKNILFYKRNHMEEIPYILENALEEEKNLAEIAWNGSCQAVLNHSWHIRAKKLLEYMDKTALKILC